MARPTEPSSVIKRPRTKYWYYKLGGWTQYKSSVKTTKADAITVALETLDSPPEAPGGPTVRKYVEPFFVRETCPHVKRLVSEGKSIIHYHVRDTHSIMENHLLTDPIVKVPLSGLTLHSDRPAPSSRSTRVIGGDRADPHPRERPSEALPWHRL